jgi:DNA-binding transcriptional MerR regulator
MERTTDAKLTLKVGELARRTGLTVRTLHHYDAIGLLSPSRRTPSGHRLYALAEVRRLQQIASLRQVGLSLDDIRRCLDRPEYTLEQVLEVQIRRLREEMARQRRLLGQLEQLLDRVRDESEGLSIEDLTRSVQATVDYGKYYTPEQLERIARRGAELGPERIRRAQLEWKELFAAFERAMEQGLDPASDAVQTLGRRALALVEDFTGGDEGIRAALARMYQEEGGERMLARHGQPVEGGVWDYYMRAMKARGRFGGGPGAEPRGPSAP